MMTTPYQTSILPNTQQTTDTNETLQETKDETFDHISKEEAIRLRKYVEMARKNDVFSPEAAYDFYRLGELITQERSDDKGAWDILILATIIYMHYSSTERYKT